MSSYAIFHRGAHVRGGGGGGNVLHSRKTDDIRLKQWAIQLITRGLRIDFPHTMNFGP